MATNIGLLDQWKWKWWILRAYTNDRNQYKHNTIIYCFKRSISIFQYQRLSDYQRLSVFFQNPDTNKQHQKWIVVIGYMTNTTNCLSTLFYSIIYKIYKKKLWSWNQWFLYSPLICIFGKFKLQTFKLSCRISSITNLGLLFFDRLSERALKRMEFSREFWKFLLFLNRPK